MQDFDKLAIAAVSPLGSAMVVLALGVMASGARRHRLAALLCACALAWLGLWATPLASHALARAMEAESPPVAVGQLPRAGAIVVLGGGLSPARPGYPWPGMSAAADRLWHAARLFRAGKAPLLLLSGGTPPESGVASEASAMRQLLQEWGIPASAMLLEERSLNTRQNAAYSAELLRQRGVRQVLLVTSALHMPRALRDFQTAGLTVIPAAIDHEGLDLSLEPWWARWLPSARALELSGRAMKELAAKVALHGKRIASPEPR